jgi:hypothetical protein
MNARGGDTCDGDPVISLCRETLTVEALAWTDFALCVLTLLAACFWVRSSNRSYVRLFISLFCTVTDLSLTIEGLLLRLNKGMKHQCLFRYGLGPKGILIYFTSSIPRRVLYPPITFLYHY